MGDSCPRHEVAVSTPLNWHSAIPPRAKVEYFHIGAAGSDAAKWARCPAHAAVDSQLISAKNECSSDGRNG